MPSSNEKPMRDIRPPSGPLKLKKIESEPLPPTPPLPPLEKHPELEHHEHTEHHRHAPRLREPHEREARIADFFGERKERVTLEETVLPPPPRRPIAGPRIKISHWYPGRPKGLRTWLIMGGIATFVITVGFLLSTTFAIATITLVPIQETHDLRLSFTVTSGARDIDIAHRVIPGEMIEFTESHSVSVPASGTKFVSTKAEGTIAITNSFSNQPQVLIQNTRFESSSGKIFRLTKAITVPAAGTKNGALVSASIDAAVVADQPGDSYNLPATTFHVAAFKGTPRYQGFVGKSSEPFTGGFEGNAKVASESDIQKGTERATAELFNQLRDDLGGKVPEGFLIVDGAREIAISGVSVAHAAAGDTLPITATGKVRAMAYRASDENTLIGASLSSSEMPRVFLPEKSSIERGGVSFDAGGKMLALSLSGSAVTKRRIDTQAVRDAVQGRPAAELQGVLASEGGIESFTVKFFPFWLRQVPASQKKIELQEAES